MEIDMVEGASGDGMVLESLIRVLLSKGHMVVSIVGNTVDPVLGDNMWRVRV